MSALRRVIVPAALALALAGPAAAADPTSPEAAGALTGLLESAGLPAVAAADPDSPDRFVAALYVPGIQLLVVEAVHPTPAILQQRIAAGEFREAYIDLQSTPERQGKFFVDDLGADGLRERPAGKGQPFDTVYEHGTDRTAFDGEWKDQKLTEAEYRQKHAEAERRYARMLAILGQALQQRAPAATP